VAATLSEVAIDNIPERNGQILRNYLIDRMYGQGRPAQPRYTLTITLKVAEEDLGIQADATSTRTLMNMYAKYALTDAKGKNILGGEAHSVTSYNKLSDQYAAVASRNSSLERTLDEVGEQIVNRLSLYFAEHSDASAEPQPDKQ
jgi:LPS-assembly lipoprotein